MKYNWFPCSCNLCYFTMVVETHGRPPRTANLGLQIAPWETTRAPNHNNLKGGRHVLKINSNQIVSHFHFRYRRRRQSHERISSTTPLPDLISHHNINGYNNGYHSNLWHSFHWYQHGTNLYNNSNTKLNQLFNINYQIINYPFLNNFLY